MKHFKYQLIKWYALHSLNKQCLLGRFMKFSMIASEIVKREKREKGEKNQKQTKNGA